MEYLQDISIECMCEAKGGGEGGGLPDPNKFVLATTENMSFLMLCFKLQA